MTRSFPGMDPYLEGPSWPDFHATFIVCWRKALNRILPQGYRARIDERINLIESGREPRPPRRPDVAVVHGRKIKRRPSRTTREPGVALLEPVTITLPQYEEARETRVEIVGRPGNTLVTVLELLSPYNKDPGEGQGQYLLKRDEVLRQSINLVELDLLLGGNRLPFSEPLPLGDYYAMIARANQRPKCDVYAWPLFDPLPTIPIPLRNGDPDVRLELSEVFDAALDEGEYQDDLNYRLAPPSSIPREAKNRIAQRLASVRER
jgi:uncharacterized protein DUF4058